MPSFPYEVEIYVFLCLLPPSHKPLSPPAFSVLLPPPQQLHYPIYDYYRNTIFSQFNSALAKDD